MISFMYGRTLDADVVAEILEKEKRNGGDLTFVAELFGIADKYDVPNLQTKCEGLFSDLIPVADPADDYTIMSLLLCIGPVYSTTLHSDRRLRDPLVRALMEAQMRRVISDNTELQEEFDKQKMAQPLVAVDMLNVVLTEFVVLEPTELSVVECVTCRTVLGHWNGTLKIWQKKASYAEPIVFCGRCKDYRPFNQTPAAEMEPID
ncbi:hypothetical protein K402DRAFT_193777 [Aulographum hederae CBS 113979]|uniref:BTB domain-containing protein n=1 Tax=Aulographum hederae CBS 113979 TaxID=1176131 RepID=A0A6G1GNR1_9PEZI|nr:hypothetical protein K402DRAFT_193777 [Aulographum hederae CBS 113979]